MKRIFCLLLIAVMLLSGCANAAPETQPAAPETVEPTTESTTEPVPETEPAPVPNVYADGRSRPSSAGQLQVLDGKLCSQSGEPVMLRGVSSYGLSMSDRFINEELFQELSRDVGVNIFRLALYTHGMGVVGYSTGGDQAWLKQVVMRGVEAAKMQDMYAIIDWHVLQDRDPNTYIEDAKAFFAEMAETYCDYNNVLYEICNEPNGVEWADIKRYAEVIIPIIRERDPDSVIIVGTPNWSQRVDEALNDPLPYDNLLYTLHFYSASHKEDLRSLAQTTSQAGLPIFVTEYGVTSSSGGLPRDLEEADKWVEMLEEENISYCMWSFSSVPEACSALRAAVIKSHGFEDEDFSPTGQWLLNTIKTHDGQ